MAGQPERHSLSLLLKALFGAISSRLARLLGLYMACLEASPLRRVCTYTKDLLSSEAAKLELKMENETEGKFGDESLTLYTENDTNLLYDVKFFDGFVIARPATPGFEGIIAKLSYGYLSDNFTPFQGSTEEIKSIRRGECFDTIVVEIKNER